ncbi:MAG: hypothetical protein ABWZ30_00930 [Jiangellaceae bacterium]
MTFADLRVDMRVTYRGRSGIVYKVSHPSDPFKSVQIRWRGDSYDGAREYIGSHAVMDRFAGELQLAA